jgi:hypothetical protein
MSKSEAPLPDLAVVLGSLLQRVPDEQKPLLIAIAERRAAERYRRWANEVTEPGRARLLACAEREEQIAALVEALHPGAAAMAPPPGGRLPPSPTRASGATPSSAAPRSRRTAPPFWKVCCGRPEPWDSRPGSSSVSPKPCSA